MARDLEAGVAETPLTDDQNVRQDHSGIRTHFDAHNAQLLVESDVPGWLAAADFSDFESQFQVEEMDSEGVDEFESTAGLIE